MDEVEGDGWRLVRPMVTVPYEAVRDIDAELPDAEWLWTGLERFCVAECCGLAAFDLSFEAVRWARGDEMDEPEGYSYRVENPGDAGTAANGLRRAAGTLREHGREPVKSTRLNEVATAASFAELFEDLAAKLVSSG